MYCDLVIAVAVLQLYLIQIYESAQHCTQMAAIRLHSDQIWCCNKTHQSCAAVVAALQTATMDQQDPLYDIALLAVFVFTLDHCKT